MRIAEAAAVSESIAIPEPSRNAPAPVPAPAPPRVTSDKEAAKLITAHRSGWSIARLFSLTRFLEDENRQLKQRVAELEGELREERAAWSQQFRDERAAWDVERRALTERLLGSAAAPPEDPEEMLHPVKRAFKAAALRVEIADLERQLQAVNVLREQQTK